MTLRFIDKYEIVSTLGRGSMGVVYKAKDPEIGRLVAIKTLKSVFMGDDAAGNEALQRFRQESRSAGKLHHPNIVTIFEAGRTDNGSPYIVMEYIEGKSVEAMLAEGGAQDPLAVLHYLAQIASAIDYAHSQSVIHRDIKPSNIIVDARHRPYLLDFGVAKLSDTSLTPAGTVVGTPSYMSPEQIRGSQLDGRTDLFSLAVVTFEAFTGQRPFPGTDFTTVVSNIIHKEPLSFSEVSAKLPAELEKVLNRGLSKERDERNQNALEFITACAQVFGVVIDGTGLAGGYTPGLKLPDAEARAAATRTRAATEPGAFQPQSEAVSSGSSAGLSAAESPSKAQTLFDASPLEEVTTMLQQPEELKSPGYTNGASGAKDSASQGAIDGPKKSESGKKDVTGFARAADAFSSYAPSGTEPAKKRRSALPLILFLALVAGVGLVAVLRPGLLATLGLHFGAGDDADEADEADESDEPDVAPAPDVAPIQSELTSPEEETPPPVVVPPPPVETAAPTPAETPAPQRWNQPARPSTGFTESSVQALNESELGWLLTPENTDADAYRLAILEAGKRSNHDLTVLLAAAAKNPDFKIRVDVLKVLSKSSYHSRQPEVGQAMRDALRDSEFIVRGFAVKSLSSVEGSKAVPALEALLKEEKNAVVLKVLNDTLSQLKSGSVLR